MSETFKNVGEMLDYFAKEENIQERFVEKLMSAYPHLFPKDADGKPREPDCGAWCPVGWQPMVEELCANLCKIVEEKNVVFQIEQIKEKFGGLRFYYQGGDDNVTGMVRMAEAWADHSCEECGALGKIRGGGWIRTLCDTHEAERQQHMKERLVE